MGNTTTTPPPKQPTPRTGFGTGKHRRAVLEGLGFALTPEPDSLAVRCHYCSEFMCIEWDGKKLGCYSGAQFDHVDPLALGGCDCPCNLVPACSTCNASKGVLSLLHWRWKLEQGDTSLSDFKRLRIIKRLINIELGETLIRSGGIA